MPEQAWQIAGSYYESCNCEAVCPCRRLDSKPGARSTYGICQFILSWRIIAGAASATELGGLNVAMAGFYKDDEPGEPWSVKLYIDERANDAQHKCLADIFLGRAGGNLTFTAFIATVLDTRRARIELDHRAGGEWVKVQGAGEAKVLRRAAYEGTVTCGIPGHDHPGTESVSSIAISDLPLDWSYEARCGFATDFRYNS